MSIKSISFGFERLFTRSLDESFVSLFDPRLRINLPSSPSSIPNSFAVDSPIVVFPNLPTGLQRGF
jgi:hypothetical protein